MTYGATDIHETLADAREARLQDEGAPQPKFCKDCRYYVAADDPRRSICGHVKALMSGSEYFVTGDVNGKSFYPCIAMRAGLCKDGKLWEPKS